MNKLTINQRITYLAFGVITGLAWAYFYNKWKVKNDS